MKSKTGFWRSLEEYVWSVVKRSPLPRYWQWIGIGLMGIVLLASALNVKNSVVGARGSEEVVSKAAERGDYETAKELFNQRTKESENRGVLGAETDPSSDEASLEDRVYPEKVVERRIDELEEKLGEYPGDREIYLALADLYGQLGNQDKSDEYREKARVLDPNNPIFQP